MVVALGVALRVDLGRVAPARRHRQLRDDHLAALRLAVAESVGQRRAFGRVHEEERAVGNV